MRSIIAVILFSLIYQTILASEFQDIPLLESNSAYESDSNMAYFPDRENYFYFSGGIIPMLFGESNSSSIGGSFHIGYGHTARYVGMEVFTIGEIFSNFGSLFLNFAVGTLLIIKVPIDIDYRTRFTPFIGVGPALNLSNVGISPAIYAKAGFRVEFYRYFLGANFSVLPLYWIEGLIPSINLEIGIKF